MGPKTEKNLYEAFVGEAKAYFRLLAYAAKAEEEGLPEVAALFRAVAEAERIHATRNLQLLGDVVVKETEANLQASFAREERAASTTPASSRRQRRKASAGRPSLSATRGMWRRNTPTSTARPSAI